MADSQVPQKRTSRVFVPQRWRRRTSGRRNRVESQVPSTTSFRPGVRGRRLPAPKTLPRTPRSPAQNARVAPARRPPANAVPERPIHRVDTRERTLCVPANPLAVELELRPDREPRPAWLTRRQPVRRPSTPWCQWRQYRGPPDNLTEPALRARVDEVGYPLRINALAGGGSQELRRVAVSGTNGQLALTVTGIDCPSRTVPRTDTPPPSLSGR